MSLFFKLGSKYEALHDLAVVGLSLVRRFSCCLRTGGAAGERVKRITATRKFQFSQKRSELIRQDYVDDNKTSYHDLINAAMKGMLSSLDPHSQFMDPDDFRDMQDDTRSRFNGLGIEVSMKNGLPTVITAMEDTPAAKAGILSGDQILRINGISTERMDLQDAINVLRGPAGAKLTLTLLRPSTKEIKEYTLQRAEIKIQSVKGARLLDPELTGPFKIGYIRLVQFNEPTADELSKALDELQKQGMQALILDLAEQSGWAVK